MKGKRALLFEAKWFCFVIAVLVVAVFAFLQYQTRIPDQMEDSILDLHYRIKMGRQSQAVQAGAVLTQQDLKLSQDILILGVDTKTLADYGKWPFPRARHADLVNAFARLSNQLNRESALFIDFFFIEPDSNPTNDALMVEAMSKAGNTYLETILKSAGSASALDDEVRRQSALYETHGRITNVKGDWKAMRVQYGIESPLEAYSRASGGYGHANYYADPDAMYRRQPLILRSAVLQRTLRLEELTPGYSVNEAVFERLAWEDRLGHMHDIDTPLSQAGLEELRARMEKEAPARVEDVDLDGVPEDSFFVINFYKDEFVPAITLSLALNYFHRSLEEVEVVAGSHILIPSPMVLDAESGELTPYSIQVRPDKFDADNNLIEEGERRPIPEIRIPINEYGDMLINFMGPRSSSDPEGHQTFPVRSYSTYAARDPGPDPALWRRTLAVANKVIMVGAFASGLADDEKPTPLGMMYGIELHANALNTILMDNFISEAPRSLNLAVLALLCLIVAFYSSRLPSIWAFFLTMVLALLFFWGVNRAFDDRAYLLAFATPSLAAILTFISVVVYRVFTEERDKRQIRETFGKYLSPKVVDQLANDPPELGGVDKELTVFFSDIRGFTTLSENMTPQELVNHLNEYLTMMTDMALDYGATLDKYMGDAIMCFWGAPIPQKEHAALACKCALRQIEALKKLNQSWPEAKRFNIGIGLNSGIMTVGNMGSKLRMNYTLMGDNVNLGSRLEAINKEYGTSIVISENTYALVKDRFIVRELDNIRVKGKNKPVLIYELVDCLESLDPPALGPVKKEPAGKRAKAGAQIAKAQA